MLLSFYPKSYPFGFMISSACRNTVMSHAYPLEISFRITSELTPVRSDVFGPVKNTRTSTNVVLPVETRLCPTVCPFEIFRTTLIFTSVRSDVSGLVEIADVEVYDVHLPVSGRGYCGGYITARVLRRFVLHIEYVNPQKDQRSTRCVV